MELATRNHLNSCGNSYLYTKYKMEEIFEIIKEGFLNQEVVLISIDKYNTNKTDMVNEEIKNIIKNIHSIEESQESCINTCINKQLQFNYGTYKQVNSI